MAVPAADHREELARLSTVRRIHNSAPTSDEAGDHVGLQHLKELVSDTSFYVLRA
jgi:hypothetical protein